MSGRQINDKRAMTLIHDVMNADEEWSPDTLDAIAEIVRLTGREVLDCNE